MWWNSKWSTDKAMIKLDEFIKLKLPITWTLIDIGFKGSDIFFGELETLDIIEYAESLLYLDNYYAEVAELAGEKKENIFEVDKYIKILSSYENCCWELEFEKWTVCYVNKCIQTKYDNCIYGLVELADIWVKLKMPKDSPFVFQGVNNSIKPEEYYTMQNYEKLYQSHVDWVKNKLYKLQHLTKK